jgi:hypothetical protein
VPPLRDLRGRDGQRGGEELVDLERREPGHHADDIDDGVQGPDLMELDIRGRAAVDPALGLGDPGQHGHARGADRLG